MNSAFAGPVMQNKYMHVCKILVFNVETKTELSTMTEGCTHTIYTYLYSLLRVLKSDKT